MVLGLGSLYTYSMGYLKYSRLLVWEQVWRLRDVGGSGGETIGISVTLLERLWPDALLL